MQPSDAIEQGHRFTLPIVTDRLELRAYVPADIDAIHTALYGDAQARMHTGGVSSLAETRATIEDHIDRQRLDGYSFWAVVERATGAIVGEAGLKPFEDGGPDVELGYAFTPGAWGRGYATEASRAIIAAAFGPLGLRRVVAVARDANAGSRHVLAKLGFADRGHCEVYDARLRYFVLERERSTGAGGGARPGRMTRLAAGPLAALAVAATLVCAPPASASATAASPAAVGVTAGSDADENVDTLTVEPDLARSERVVYSVAVPYLQSGEQLRVRGEAEVSICIPNDPCGVGNFFGYAPKIRVRLVLATTPSATRGAVLAEEVDRCAPRNRHCPLSATGDHDITADDAPRGRHVNLVVGATWSKAGPNDRIDVRSGGGRLGGQLSLIRLAARHPAAEPGRPAGNGSAAIPIQTRWRHDPPPVPVVVYSQPVGDLKAGDVLDVAALMVAKIDRRIPKATAAPAVATRLVLVGDAAAIEADPARGEVWIGGTIGGNCRARCRVRRAAAIQVGQNLSAMHVNLVAMASRTTKEAEDACPPVDCRAKILSKRGSLVVTRFSPRPDSRTPSPAQPQRQPQPRPGAQPQPQPGPQPEPARQQPPEVSTSDATDVDCHGATLHGVVRPHQLPTTYAIDYWLDGNFDRRQTIGGSAGSNGPATVDRRVSGLQRDARYRFRIRATNAAGQESVSDMRPFDTPKRC